MHQLTCVALPNSFSPEAEREILDILSPELRVRMQRIAIESKRRTAMAGAVLVRLLAAEATGIPNTELRFSVRSNGKPYVENAPDFCFNLTHTKEFFAVATANTEIGVDAEAVRPCKLQIARRFFTSNECAYVEAEDTPRRFF
jgi:4'-phosphopantetheinyl transferase